MLLLSDPAKKLSVEDEGVGIRVGSEVRIVVSYDFCAFLVSSKSFLRRSARIIKNGLLVQDAAKGQLERVIPSQLVGIRLWRTQCRKDRCQKAERNETSAHERLNYLRSMDRFQAWKSF